VAEVLQTGEYDLPMIVQRFELSFQSAELLLKLCGSLLRGVLVLDGGVTLLADGCVERNRLC